MRSQQAQILPILEWPHPILQTPSSPVNHFDQQLAEDIEVMWNTMYDAEGIGLAAPQVGDRRRIFVMDCTPRQKTARALVCINPELLHLQGQVNSAEGCLSFPGLAVEVPRSEVLTLKAQDLKGQWFEMQLEGMEAICAQHEMDHLNGKSFLDLLGPLERVACFQSYVEKLEKSTAPHLSKTIQLAQEVLSGFIQQALNGEVDE